MKTERKEEVKTYKVKINDMEIEVPEGFEVVVDKDKIVLRKGDSNVIAGTVQDILKELREIKEEGLHVYGAVGTI